LSTTAPSASSVQRLRATEHERGAQRDRNACCCQTGKQRRLRRAPGTSRERARDEERRRRDREVVPVDVDEPVDEERGRHECERELVVPAPARRACEQHDGRAEQNEADDPRLGEKLERDVVRLGRLRRESSLGGAGA